MQYLLEKTEKVELTINSQSSYKFIKYHLHWALVVFYSVFFFLNVFFLPEKTANK